MDENLRKICSLERKSMDLFDGPSISVRIPEGSPLSEEIKEIAGGKIKKML